MKEELFPMSSIEIFPVSKHADKNVFVVIKEWVENETSLRMVRVFTQFPPEEALRVKQEEKITCLQVGLDVCAEEELDA